VGKTLDDDYSAKWTNSSSDISTFYYTKKVNFKIGDLVLFCVLSEFFNDCS